MSDWIPPIPYLYIPLESALNELSFGTKINGYMAELWPAKKTTLSYLLKEVLHAPPMCGPVVI